MRIFCNAKDSHIFPTKNNSVFVIFKFKNFNETLTNNNVNFEQPAPRHENQMVFNREQSKEQN